MVFVMNDFRLKHYHLRGTGTFSRVAVGGNLRKMHVLLCSLELQEVNHEIEVLRRFQHPNILSLVDASIVPSVSLPHAREVRAPATPFLPNNEYVPLTAHPGLNPHAILSSTAVLLSLGEAI